MAREKKRDDIKEVVVEVKVPMHCNARKRAVAKIISKFKGVERFTTEMYKHKVVVISRIDPQKLFKKLKRETGKKVEIVASKLKGDDDQDKGSNNNNIIINNVGQSSYINFGEQPLLQEFSPTINAARMATLLRSLQRQRRSNDV